MCPPAEEPFAGCRFSCEEITVLIRLIQVFLFLHNLFVHISANYGFGQDQTILPFEDGVKAHMWELIGQTFIITGMGMSKMSLALFLLRIVIVRWHRLAIWGVGGSLLFASCLTAILCWFQVSIETRNAACRHAFLTRRHSVSLRNEYTTRESKEDVLYILYHGHFYLEVRVGPRRFSDFHSLTETWIQVSAYL